MKRIAETRQAIVGVPIIAEPIEVQNPLLAIPVEARDVPVAIRVAPLCAEYHPYHHPSNDLRIESDLESINSLIFCTEYLHFLEIAR
jgi:hypothetical protein